MPQEILKQYQRKLTNTMYKEDKEKIKLNEALKNDKISSTIIFDKVVTPLTETNPQYPPKFMEIYRKSIREDELDNIDNQSDKNKFNNNITATNQDTIKNSQSLLKDANVNDSFLLKKKLMFLSIILTTKMILISFLICFFVILHFSFYFHHFSYFYFH